MANELSLRSPAMSSISHEWFAIGFKNVGLHTTKLLFIYTPGGAEGLFVEGGDEPRPGVQVDNWGPERFDERMLGLFHKYGVEAV